jgi:hypothetical protein
MYFPAHESRGYLHGAISCSIFHAHGIERKHAVAVDRASPCSNFNDSFPKYGVAPLVMGKRDGNLFLRFEQTKWTISEAAN